MKEEKWYRKLFQNEPEQENYCLQNRRLAAYEAFKKNKYKSKVKPKEERHNT